MSGIEVAGGRKIILPLSRAVEIALKLSLHSRKLQNNQQRQNQQQLPLLLE